MKHVARRAVFKLRDAAVEMVAVKMTHEKIQRLLRRRDERREFPVRVLIEIKDQYAVLKLRDESAVMEKSQFHARSVSLGGCVEHRRGFVNANKISRIDFRIGAHFVDFYPKEKIRATEKILIQVPLFEPNFLIEILLLPYRFYL